MSTALPYAQPDVLPTGFDPAGFVGELAADGQRVRVSALATDDEGRVEPSSAWSATRPR